MPRCQKGSLVKNLLYEKRIYLHLDKNLFACQRLCTKPRFDNNTKCNLELWLLFKLRILSWHPSTCLLSLVSLVCFLLKIITNNFVTLKHMMTRFCFVACKLPKSVAGLQRARPIPPCPLTSNVFFFTPRPPPSFAMESGYLYRVCLQVFKW